MLGEGDIKTRTLFIYYYTSQPINTSKVALLPKVIFSLDFVRTFPVDLSRLPEVFYFFENRPLRKVPRYLRANPAVHVVATLKVWQIFSE